MTPGYAIRKDTVQQYVPVPCLVVKTTSNFPHRIQILLSKLTFTCFDHGKQRYLT